MKLDRLRRRRTDSPVGEAVKFVYRIPYSLLSGGVATRILVASSTMLLGIVLTATMLSYSVLSNAHRERYEDTVRASAEAFADTMAVNAMTPAMLQSQLIAAKRTFNLDYFMTVPVNDMRAGQLSSGTADQPARKPSPAPSASGLDTPSGVGVEKIPRLNAEEVKRVEDGESLLVFKEGDGGGVLYAIEPIIPTPAGVGSVAVVTGVEESTVREGFRLQAWTIFGNGLFTVVLGSAAVWLTSRGLRRATGDFGAAELGGLITFYRSVLRAVSDGLLLLDSRLGVVLYNAEAAKLLGLPERDSDELIQIKDLPVPDSLRELIASGRYARDEIHYTDTRVLLVNQQPAVGEADGRNWVTTLRDHTELRKLTGELLSVQSFSDSLRSQTHEFANRMHLIASLIEMGESDKALEYATHEISMMDRPNEDVLGGVEQPVVSALLFTKMTQARENDIQLNVYTQDLRSPLPGDERDLVTILGNLLDNAFDAVSRQDVDSARRRVAITLSGSADDGFTIVIVDDGKGIAEADLDSVFAKGWSTKHAGVENDTGRGTLKTTSPRGMGMSLIDQAVRRLGGAIDADGGLGEDAEPGDYRGAEFTVWLPPDPAGGETADD